MGLLVIGAVYETSARSQETLAMEEGQSLQAGDWTVTLEDVASVEGPNWYAEQARLIATRGTTRAVMEPSKRYYPAARMPTTETAIHKTGTGDLYVALGDGRNVDGVTRWTFQVFVNPLIDFIYLGCLFMALGGLLCIGGRKRDGTRA